MYILRRIITFSESCVQLYSKRARTSIGQVEMKTFLREELYVGVLKNFMKLRDEDLSSRKTLCDNNDIVFDNSGRNNSMGIKELLPLANRFLHVFCVEMSSELARCQPRFYVHDVFENFEQFGHGIACDGMKNFLNKDNQSEKMCDPTVSAASLASFSFCFRISSSFSCLVVSRSFFARS